MPTYYVCGALASPDPPERDVIEEYDWCGSDSCVMCRFRDDDDDDRDDDDRYAIDDAIAIAEEVAELGSSLPDMYIPSATRMVSCEFEGSRGIAAAYSALSHIGQPCSHHGDVTCDGEIVFSRMVLANRADAERYAVSCRVLELMRGQGRLSVSYACGHHIHVSAVGPDGRGMSPASLVSLYSVYAHCEDLLYRLAAAGWAEHRIERDSSYAAPMAKVAGRKSPKTVGNAIGHDRYQGLNVSPYVDGMQSCRCGAYRFGCWEECECGDGRKTIEWRLWNGSVSARKIRAYIAISHALTDYAANVDPRDVTHLPEYPFQGTGCVDEDSLAAQLDYLTSRPGLGSRERADIYWLASFAPGMGSLAKDARTARDAARLEGTGAAPALAYV